MNSKGIEDKRQASLTSQNSVETLIKKSTIPNPYYSQPRRTNKQSLSVSLNKNFEK